VVLVLTLPLLFFCLLWAPGARAAEAPEGASASETSQTGGGAPLEGQTPGTGEGGSGEQNAQQLEHEKEAQAAEEKAAKEQAAAQELKKKEEEQATQKNKEEEEQAAQTQKKKEEEQAGPAKPPAQLKTPAEIAAEAKAIREQEEQDAKYLHQGSAAPGSSAPTPPSAPAVSVPAPAIISEVSTTPDLSELPAQGSPAPAHSAPATGCGVEAAGCSSGLPASELPQLAVSAASIAADPSATPIAAAAAGAARRQTPAENAPSAPRPLPGPGGSGGTAAAGSGAASSASAFASSNLLPNISSLATRQVLLDEPSWRTPFFVLIPERPG